MATQAAMATGVHRAQSQCERLESGLNALSVQATAFQQQQLLDFLALLQKWNGVYNLTSVRDPIDMLPVHLLDSLSIVPLIDRLGATTLLDVGSGAGLPAIPLAIVRPLVEVHSVDAVAKKVGFQLQAKTTLRLGNLHPLHARVELVALAQPPQIVVSRAFADICTMLGAIDHLIGEDTTVIAMKGKTPTEEIASLPSDWNVERVDLLDVPFLGAERCAVVLRRVSSGAALR